MVSKLTVSKGNHPQMAARFRLVNYYNLPRKMVMTWGWFTFMGLPHYNEANVHYYQFKSHETFHQKSLWP